MALQIQPRLRIGTEVPSKPERSVGSNRALAVNNLVDPPGRNADRLGQRVLAEPERAHKIFQQDFARMDGFDIALVHDSCLVVVRNFDVIRMPFPPEETDAPLIVDSNAVLARPVAFEAFQPISGRNAQKVKLGCGVELQQLAQRGSADVRWNLFVTPPREKRLGSLIGE